MFDFIFLNYHFLRIDINEKLNKMIDVILTILALALPPLLVLGNLSEKNELLNMFIYILLGLLCMGMVGGGLLLVVIGTSLDGYVFIVMGAISALILLKPVRVLIATLIDINPKSCLHTIGLVFASILVVSLISISFFMPMAETPQMNNVIMTGAMVMQNIFFVMLAFLAVGVLIRRNMGESLKRLGLVTPSLTQILIGFGAVFILFAVGIPIELLMNYLTPESSESIEKVMYGLLGNITIISALIIAISVGVGEEILFRGAIQPRFGIPFTAFLFAIVHVQYPNILAILLIFIIGIILGVLRKKTNTVVPIIAHITYDFIAFLAFILIS